MKKSQNVTVLGDKENHRGNVQGWVQTDKTAHQAMYKLNLQMPAALTVLHFMISRMARGTSGVVMSHQAIANQIGIHKQTVAKAISLLDKLQYIQTQKIGNQNVYILNGAVAWQGKRGYRYASFYANVLVDESEQSTPVDELIERAKTQKHIPVIGSDERMYVTNDEIDPPDQTELDLP